MPRITITEPEKTPQPYQFDLETDVVRIGRGEENEIVLTCGSISSHHAEMARVPGGFEIRDLGSTNGVSKENVRVDSCFLSDGDQVMLGDVTFDFKLSEDELAALAGEQAGVEGTPAGPTPVVIPERPREMPRRVHPSKRTPAPARPMVATPSGASGWWLVLAVLVLGTGAFYAGLSLRHKNETGITLGEAMKKRLSTPDVARLAERDPELYSEFFIKPSEDEEEDELDIVVTAPPVQEEVPPEIEGWENRERPDDWEGQPDTGVYEMLVDDDNDDEDGDEDGDGEEPRDDRERLDDGEGDEE